ncbi:MAG: hypothetical protein K8W52_33210 [Deltaproteobacteria bacterium]|nr:hypothetical protein [Deltaproteobacteria bacterium]
MIRTALLALALAACGSKTPAPAEPDDTLTEHPATGVHADTEIHRRRDAACEALAPRITACAVEDAKATMTPEELKSLDLPATTKIHQREFIKQCTADELSSRQVRVYEVCTKEAPDCAALDECLKNAEPGAGEHPHDDGNTAE